MDLPPLGNYRQLESSTPLPWGSGTVVHGSAVLDDLVAGVDRFRRTCTEGYWSRLGPQSAALGCVPWLTDPTIADVLASLGGCCIVVDKQQPNYRAATYLAENGSGLSNLCLEGFAEMARPDPSGGAPVISPGSPPLEPVELGPVRVAGWARATDGRQRPTLHSKMLVLGVVTYYENDEDFSGDIFKFEPKLTWMGSANWTLAARRHIESAIWSNDPDLVNHNYSYLLGVLRLSEQRRARTAGPEPELVSATWDNAAFAEWAAELRDAYEPEDGEY